MPQGDGLKETLLALAEQHPLLDTDASRATLDNAASARLALPQHVFLGIGVCTGQHLTGGVPVDILGMLLPAMLLRKRLGARRIIALVADRHATTNAFPYAEVCQRARETRNTLLRLAEVLGIRKLEVVLASELHNTQTYRNCHARVVRQAPANAHPYVVLQAADVLFLESETGGILKVGWAIGQKDRRGIRADEVVFDQLTQHWVGRPFARIYTKPGRVFDDERPKSAPYVVTDRKRRLCFAPGENVSEKLESARRLVSEGTYRGVRRHLGHLVRALNEIGDTPKLCPAEKLQSLIDRMYADRRLAGRGRRHG